VGFFVCLGKYLYWKWYFEKIPDKIMSFFELKWLRKFLQGMCLPTINSTRYFLFIFLQKLNFDNFLIFFFMEKIIFWSLWYLRMSSFLTCYENWWSYEIATKTKFCSCCYLITSFWTKWRTKWSYELIPSPCSKILMGVLSMVRTFKRRHILTSNPKIKLYSDACIDMLQYTNQAFLEQKPHDLFYKVQTDIRILPVISNIKSKARHHHTRKHVRIRSKKEKVRANLLALSDTKP